MAIKSNDFTSLDGNAAPCSQGVAINGGTEADNTITNSSGVLVVRGANGVNFSASNIIGLQVIAGGVVKFPVFVSPANKVLMLDSSNQVQATFVTNSNIDTNANIARNKIAAGTAYKVIFNDASGYISEANGFTFNGSQLTVPALNTDYITVSGALTSTINNAVFSGTGTLSLQNTIIAGSVFFTGTVDASSVNTTHLNVTSASLNNVVSSGSLHVYGQGSFNNVYVSGSLSVLGSASLLHTEHIVANDPIMVLNNGEVGSGVTAGFSGIDIDRGTGDTYRFGFDESTDTFRVGVVGSLQPIATRQDSPISNGIPFWVGSSYTFNTISGLTFNPAINRLSVPGSLAVPVGDTSSRDNPAINGLLRFNTDLNSLEVYNGRWEDLSALTGFQPVVCVSDSNIPGVYDNGTNGIGATLTISSASLAIDGHTLLVNDTILLSGQVDSSENGVYNTTSIGSGSIVLTRSVNFDTISKLHAGRCVISSSGTKYTNIIFVLKDSVDTTGAPQTWIQASLSGNDVQSQSFTITTAEANTLNFARMFGGIPQVISLMFFDGTNYIPLDESSYVASKTDSTLTYNTNDLTFGSNGIVYGKAFYISANSNNIPEDWSSEWLISSAVLSVSHPFLDPLNISYYNVLELNVTSNQTRVLPEDKVVLYASSSAFALDWAGVSPSATLKYKIQAWN